MTAQALGTAGRIQVLVTNDGKPHSATDWATVSADDLVSIDPQASLERQARARELKASLRGILCEAFSAVSPASSGTAIEEILRQAMSRMREIFAASPWAADASHPSITAQMETYLRRNLFSAADVALRTE